MGLLGLAMGKKPWPIIGMGDYRPATVVGWRHQPPKIGGWRVSDFPGLKGLDAGMGLEGLSGGIIAGAGRGRPCVAVSVGRIGWCFAGLDDGWIHTTSPLSN